MKESRWDLRLKPSKTLWPSWAQKPFQIPHSYSWGFPGGTVVRIYLPVKEIQGTWV